MKLFILIFLSSIVLRAEDKKCNPVSIKVDASPVFYAIKAKDKAEENYKAATNQKNTDDKIIKLQEAVLQYREAYKNMSDSRNAIATAVIDNQCPEAPVLYGTPNPATGAQ